MTAMSDRYQECCLFVDADDRAAVLADLARRYGVVPAGRQLLLPGAEIDVVSSDKPTPGGPDTFIEWGTKIEFYATAMPDTEVVRSLTDLMVFLRARGNRVVAACDFEDELPQTDFR